MVERLVLVTWGKETSWRFIHRTEYDIRRNMSEMRCVCVAAGRGK